MKLPLFLHKIFNKKKLCTAYHEAGHCVIAAIFSDKLELRTLSVNKAYMNKIDSNYRGGLNLEWFQIPNQADHDSADHLILIALGGICAKTIYTKGTSYVKQNLDQFQNNPQKFLDLEGAFDDYEIVKSYSKPLAVILNTKKEIIEWSAFRWNFEFLMDTQIWKATKSIAEDLIMHPSQTMDSIEIKDSIEKSRLPSILDHSIQTFLSKRYPLSVQKLKV